MACTCLSAEPHEDNVRDVVAHYLGCIEFGERANFFQPRRRYWKIELDRLISAQIQQEPWEKQEALSPHFALSGKYDPKARRDLEHRVRNALNHRMVETKARCQAELDRIARKRAALAVDVDEKHLVRQLEDSRAALQRTPAFQHGLELVRSWRQALMRPNQETPPSAINSLQDGEPTRNLEPTVDFEARLMVFDKDGRPARELPGVQGLFPHQTLPLGRVLDDSQHLRRRATWDGVQYYHLPANNMDWVEKAISHYFQEKRPEFEAATSEHGEESHKRAYQVLQPQFWRGRQNCQDNAPVQRRQMLPLCSTLAVDNHDDGTSMSYDTDTNTDNLVVFMPYLHYESSRAEASISRLISKLSTQNKLAMQRAANEDRLNRQKQRALLQLTRSPTSDAALSAKAEPHPELRTGLGRFQTQHTTRSRIHRAAHPLGQYLLDAASLFEAMSLYEDKLLLRTSLFRSPPLHPRRTLAQSHGQSSRAKWATSRDQFTYQRDGVVHSRHAWNKFQESTRTEETKLGALSEPWLEQINTTSKVLMVDQLWLWILDGSTLITAFPSQYGSEKNESSDVHKAVRSRLHKLGRIDDAFSLGLVVLDECANRVFDRAAMSGSGTREQPILEVLTDAIGHLRRQQNMALEHILIWSQRAKTKVFGAGQQDILNLDIPILDITAETKLQMEANDIIDELGVMIGIVKTQLQILETYISLGQEQQQNGEKWPRPGRWFNRAAYEMRLKFRDRHERLVGLQNTAQNMALGMKDILALKEQQDNLFQAWRAQIESIETVTQGRAIVVFTVVTIIFLPLSFLSSVFGMNTSELSSDNNMTFLDEFKYMFPISAAVSLLTIVLAFSRVARTLIRHAWSHLKSLMITFLGYTRLYRVWLGVVQWADPEMAWSYQSNVFWKFYARDNYGRPGRRKHASDERWGNRKGSDRAPNSQYGSGTSAATHAERYDTYRRQAMPWPPRQAGSNDLDVDRVV